MTLGDLILQNFFGIVGSVIASVLGWLAIRILRNVRDSTQRTEEHAETAVANLSALDRLSTASFRTDLEAWKQEVTTSVAAVADNRSDALAWQAKSDRRLAALEQFAKSLNDFAHGRAGVPTYTAPMKLDEGTIDDE